jgi:hypothetical protein
MTLWVRPGAPCGPPEPPGSHFLRESIPDSPWHDSRILHCYGQLYPGVRHETVERRLGRLPSLLARRPPVCRLVDVMGGRLGRRDLSLTRVGERRGAHCDRRGHRHCDGRVSIQCARSTEPRRSKVTCAEPLTSEVQADCGRESPSHSPDVAIRVAGAGAMDSETCARPVILRIARTHSRHESALSCGGSWGSLRGPRRASRSGDTGLPAPGSPPGDCWPNAVSRAQLTSSPGPGTQTALGCAGTLKAAG